MKQLDKAADMTKLARSRRRLAGKVNSKQVTVRESLDLQDASAAQANHSLEMKYHTDRPIATGQGNTKNVDKPSGTSDNAGGGVAPISTVGRNLAEYGNVEYAEGVMARASQVSLNRALNEGLTGRATGARAEQFFENYAYQMQQRLMASISPYQTMLQPAADATTGARAIARTRTSFAGRWQAGTKRSDYGFHSVFEGQTNTARILSGADFTVTPNGAFGIPAEYSTAFPGARIYGIDPVNISR